MFGEFQHGHMEQVGYDMYCKLLDEVMKEIQSGKNKNNDETNDDIQIDINVSSYIPENYIENSDIKIAIYQDIALCRSEEEILDVTDEIIDRFGNMPKEVQNLLEIARIKNMCMANGISKINQRDNSVVFYLAKGKELTSDIVDSLIRHYKMKIKFSKSSIAYVTLKLDENQTEIKQIKEFLENIKIG